jgi:hypothetical protein
MKKNTIIAQLARTGSRWQHAFLRNLGFKAFHEPTGGWPEGKFDIPLSWNHYLTTRFSCNPVNFIDNFEDSPSKTDYNRAMAEKLYGNDLRDVIENSDYIEVGYASLPYIVNVPCDWRLLGAVRHPQKWIYSAFLNRFYHNQISWKPSTLGDYAKIWNDYNSLILKHSERVFRMEDFYPMPEIFAQQFGHFAPLTKEQRTIEKATTGDAFIVNSTLRINKEKELNQNDDFSWWPIVADLSEKFGYKQLSYNELESMALIGGTSSISSTIESTNSNVAKKMPSLF